MNMAWNDFISQPDPYAGKAPKLSFKLSAKASSDHAGETPQFDDVTLVVLKRE